MGVLGWVADSYIIYSSDNGAPPASADVNHQVGALPGWIARAHHSLLPEVVSQLVLQHLATRCHASLPQPDSERKGVVPGNYPLRGHKALIWEGGTRKRHDTAAILGCILLSCHVFAVIWVALFPR